MLPAFCTAALSFDFTIFYALFLCPVLIFMHARATIFRTWKLDTYLSISSFHYITEIMCCAECRIHVVETQHRVRNIPSVLWSKDLGQAKNNRCPFLHFVSCGTDWEAFDDG